MLPEGMARAFADPPQNPSECLFSRLSVNYTADLKTNVEPCVFGGDPDCSQCGCSISAGLHWIGGLGAGPLKVRHLAEASVATGALVNRVFPHRTRLKRWTKPEVAPGLVQIAPPPNERKVEAVEK
jgi:hypothetical protein